MTKFCRIFLVGFLLFSISSKQALACACGCGVFSVATSALIPNCEGGTAFLQYDHLTQSRNWSGNDSSSNHNHDKRIETQTITAGTQYMFNRDWGMAVRVPYVNRMIKSVEHGDDHVNTDAISRTNSVGDVRINAIYSGFSADMSSGITFGLKLPTGQTKAASVDERNMQIGTGSTDWILGGYKMGQISADGKFNYFTQINWQHAFDIHRGYRVGDEFAAATGIYYNAGQFGEIKKLAPILQISGAKRQRDSGWASDSINSGYTQIFFAPGIEMNFDSFKIYGDVEFPIYRQVNGTQLVAQNIYKLIFAKDF